MCTGDCPVFQPLKFYDYTSINVLNPSANLTLINLKNKWIKNGWGKMTEKKSVVKIK